jgi:hypothetical protein
MGDQSMFQVVNEANDTLGSLTESLTQAKERAELAHKETGQHFYVREVRFVWSTKTIADTIEIKHGYEVEGSYE